MADPRRFRLRVRYVKAGRLAMLSHLEVTHALERIVRRSGLPFALSEGFSPHMKMAFGPALPVGVGGTEEVFEVQLTSYLAPEKALEALRAAAPDDLAPFVCAYVEPSAPAASVAFSDSTYRVVLDAPLSCLCVPDEVTVTRKSKEKVLAVADFLVGQPELAGDELTFCLRSQQSGSLRADAFADACLRASVGTDSAVPNIVSFTREALA